MSLLTTMEGQRKKYLLMMKSRKKMCVLMMKYPMWKCFVMKMMDQGDRVVTTSILRKNASLVGPKVLGVKRLQLDLRTSQATST